MKGVFDLESPEVVINSYTPDDDEEPSVYIEIEEAVLKPPVDLKGFCLNYSYVEQRKYQKFDSYIGGLRVLETMFGRVKMPLSFPPDIKVLDPSGDVIEYHVFETPIRFDDNEFTQKIKDDLCIEYKSMLVDGNDTQLDEGLDNSVATSVIPLSQHMIIPSYVVWNEFGNIIERSEGYLTPVECIKQIEDTINGDAFWKSSKRFLSSRKKPLKRLRTAQQQVKLSKNKLSSNKLSKNKLSSIKLSSNTVLKNELYKMKTVMEREADDHEEHKIRMNTVIYNNTCKQDVVQRKQRGVMTEFLNTKDTALEILVEAKSKLEIICENLDVKIEKLHKKLKQKWRIFGKRKLRIKLSECEEIRESYGEMLKQTLTDIDSRKAFTLF